MGGWISKSPGFLSTLRFYETLEEEKKGEAEKIETRKKRGEENGIITLKRRQEGRPRAEDHFVPMSNIQAEMGEF